MEQVTIEPTGVWSPVSQGENTSGQNDSQSGSDDDLVEIREPSRVASIRNEAMPIASSVMQTPPVSSREQSIVSTGKASGGKRSHSTIIDLTMSSDEEDVPPRAPKRLSNALSVPRPRESYRDPNEGGMLGSSSNPPTWRSENLSFQLPKPTPNRPAGSADYGYSR